MTAALAFDSPPEQCHPLDVFAVRAAQLAARVGRGLTFIDAVDMAYSAAIWSGLADQYGDDAVQAVLANAFRGK
jgi:hypothetical protein